MFSSHVLPFDLIQLMQALPDSFQSDLPTDQITALYHGLGYIGIIVPLILSLVGCFFGYRLIRMFMALTCYPAGVLLGYALGVRVVHLEGIPLSAFSQLLGIALVILSFLIYKIGIFLLVFVLTFAASASLIPLTGNVQFFLCTAVGFACGMFALRHIREMIIIMTASVCGISSGGLLVTLGERMQIEELAGLSSVAASIAFAALGLLIQFVSTGGIHTSRSGSSRN